MARNISAKSITETTLFKKLTELNNPDSKSLYNSLESICDEACQRIKLAPKYLPEYTLHDEIHFVRVTELMALILGNTINYLNSAEIILLLLAAYFHDQGMVPEPSEYTTIKKDEKFIMFRDNWYSDHPNRKELLYKIQDRDTSSDEVDRLNMLIAELENAMFTDYIRITHGDRGKELIAKIYGKDPRFEIQNCNISNILGNLCQSHCFSVHEIINSSDFNIDDQVGQFKINLQYLAAVLRLADIMDFDRDRTPDILFRSIHFTSPISVLEWEKHRSVKGWQISKKRIRFTCEFEHPIFESSVRKFLDFIDEELSDCHLMCNLFPAEQKDYLLLLPLKVDRSRIKPKNSSYIYHDLEFSLSRDEIVKLLLTENLYKTKSICIRELLQNSLDALRFRKAQFKCQDADWSAGKVDFEHYQDENGYHILSCSDNGVGMDEKVIINFFTKAGRSYYRSSEFERKRVEFRSKGVDFDPCSKFGIGFMSCFMLGDKITVETRKDYGDRKGEPLIVEINGLGSLLVIRKGKDSQPIGTVVTIKSRSKREIFDFWDDEIRLCTILQGYALATEFPIKGVCKVPLIKEEVNIPIELFKPPHFLEEIPFIQKTIEVDFSEINNNIFGSLRQVFLLDPDGLPAIENDEMIICIEDKPNKTNRWVFREKSNNSEHSLFNSGYRSSVCVDGILVSGKTGRTEFWKRRMDTLGWSTPVIHNNGTFLIDIRGDIKPELSPARTPIDRQSAISEHPGWNRIQEMVDRASGVLWSEIIILISNSKKYLRLWQLLTIYDMRLQLIPKKTLLENLHVPLLRNGKINYSPLRNLGLIQLKSKGEEYELKSGNSIISFGDNLQDLVFNQERTRNLNNHLAQIILLSSKVKVNNGNIELHLIKEALDDEPLFAGKTLDTPYSSTFLMDILDTKDCAIAVQAHFPIANMNHPLSEIALRCRYNKNKTNLQHFAKSFINGIAQLLSNHGNTLTASTLLNEKSRWKRGIGTLYAGINWEDYENLQAPYKIWITTDGWVEITAEHFKKWSQFEITDSYSMR